MKILFIAPKYKGGIGGHAAIISRKLREHGFDITLMHVPHIPIKNIKNPSFVLLSTIKTLFAKEEYDIVHAFNVPSAFAMRFTKAKRKVLSIHGVYSEQVKALHSKTTSRIIKAAEPAILKWANRLTTDSQAVQKSYKERLGVEVEHLPSPLDVSMFKDINDVRKVENQVAYVGRDTYEKGIDILRNIESQIKGKVVYCTNLPWKEAMIILKSSSVLVLPSRVESLPQTVKEAFYLKVPVVATNVGGVPELVRDGVTGILVPRNNPKKLTESINLLLENKEYAKKLADAAYEFVMKNLTCEVIIPRFVQFYEKLLINQA